MYARHSRAGGTALQWLEINTAALRHNLRTVQRVVGQSVQLMPIIKSNAYGHGLTIVARALRGERLWGFGVASLEEAAALRQAGLQRRVMVLSNFLPAAIPAALVPRTSYAVYDAQQARELARRARELRTRIAVHVKLDTGTSRIGFPPSAVQAVRSVRALRELRVIGIFSHFADAEASARTFTDWQMRRFTASVNKLFGPKNAMLRHIACSAALLRFPATHGNLGRLGVSLYGLSPSLATTRACDRGRIVLRPALSWKARVLQVKSVPAGTTIGYGRTLTAMRSLRYAVLPVGYADGYDRRLSNRGQVLIRGQRCAVIGRVCMNLCMVDVTAVRGVRRHDKAVLLGRQGREEITADELAASVGTLHYEVLSRLGTHLERRAL